MAQASYCDDEAFGKACLHALQLPMASRIKLSFYAMAAEAFLEIPKHGHL